MKKIYIVGLMTFFLQTACMQLTAQESTHILKNAQTQAPKADVFAEQKQRSIHTLKFYGNTFFFCAQALVMAVTVDLMINAGQIIKNAQPHSSLPPLEVVPAVRQEKQAKQMLYFYGPLVLYCLGNSAYNTAHAIIEHFNKSRPPVISKAPAPQTAVQAVAAIP